MDSSLLDVEFGLSRSASRTKNAHELDLVNTMNLEGRSNPELDSSDKMTKARSSTYSNDSKPSRTNDERKSQIDDASTSYRNIVLGKSPCSSLGPCAHIQQKAQQVITVADPLSQRITWDVPPRNVLVIRKIHDDRACGIFNDTVRSLIEERHLTVFVEETALRYVAPPPDTAWNETTPACAKRQEFNAYIRAGQLHTFHEALNCLSNQIDFVVCIGGDGTLLHVSNLFQTSVPPVLPFNVGTLGFLTSLPVSELQTRLDALFRGESRIILRSRLRCNLYKLKKSNDSSPTASGSTGLPLNNSGSNLEMLTRLSIHSNCSSISKSSNLVTFTLNTDDTNSEATANSIATRKESSERVGNAWNMNEKDKDKTGTGNDSPNLSAENSLSHSFGMLILNDVVISRSTPQVICQLDLFVENELVTTVVGDGLIIATTTGSTAYAMSAGTSLCHPNVPAILVVPICAHSLSFRPLVLPIGVTVCIAISPNARNTYASISFDGREMRQLRMGDVLTINTSRYPVPCVCANDPLKDWFDSLRACLHWNRKL